METLTCRLLPYAVADGPTNMAADEALVRTAAEQGVTSLRFYGWSPPTLSLGYFQPAAIRLSDARLAPLPFVRRPSGGATLVHHHEVTYCLALPPDRAAGAWMPRMHAIIAATLRASGSHDLALAEGATAKHGDVLCFQQFTPGDLLVGGKKVSGSAQRKYHRALMQHGSILLARSEYTPALPGIRELTGIALTVEQVCAAVGESFADETGWALVPAEWTADERQTTAELARDKYASASWNERR